MDSLVQTRGQDMWQEIEQLEISLVFTHQLCCIYHLTPALAAVSVECGGCHSTPGKPGVQGQWWNTSQLPGRGASPHCGQGMYNRTSTKIIVSKEPVS